jgi:hypothetical protein
MVTSSIGLENNSALSSAAVQGLHVYVHDGMLRRVGELRAFDVSRSHLLGRISAATFSVLTTDTLFRSLDPDGGATIVIESETYEVPWVGYVASLAASLAGSRVTVSVREYGGLLMLRRLPDGYLTSGAMTDEFRRVLDTVNTRNETLLRLGTLDERPISVGGLRLSDQTAASAFDLIAGLGVMEWFVSFELARGEVRPLVNLVAERGDDRTSDIAWDTGPAGDAVLESWTKRGGALPAIAVVVGGDSTGTESFDARPRARSISAMGPGVGLLTSATSRPSPTRVHGYERFTPKASAPATRVEQAIVQSETINQQATHTAAEALVSRPTFAERTVSLTLLPGADWSSVRVGDLVLLKLPIQLNQGRSTTPARVTALMPREASRTAAVECELLGRPLNES